MFCLFVILFSAGRGLKEAISVQLHDIANYTNKNCAEFGLLPSLPRNDEIHNSYIISMCAIMSH